MRHHLASRTARDNGIKTQSVHRSGAARGNALLDALRARTRDVHERLHHHPALAPLTSPTLTRWQYVSALQGLQRFHQSVESALAGWPGCPRSSTALARDLQDLDAGTNPLPQSAEPLPVSSNDQALGVRYVVYGSSLGGKVIARSAARALGWPQGAPGLSHFRGDSGGAVTPWPAFIRNELHAGVNQRACVDAAQATFCGLERWLWAVVDLCGSEFDASPRRDPVQMP